MMALLDRALALNPNSARGWHLSSALRLIAGQLDLAIEHAETSLRLNPRDRIIEAPGVLSWLIGVAHFFCRRFDEAVPHLLLAIQEDPGEAPRYRFLAACYAHMGQLDDARKIITRLRTITSTVVPDGRQSADGGLSAFLRNPEHRQLFLSGLRLAMGEAG
jgi:tetratricopeptide (TPR) repeat protein